MLQGSTDLSDSYYIVNSNIYSDRKDKKKKIIFRNLLRKADIWYSNIQYMLTL